MTTLAVIPARMGSTRLPRKNLLEIEPGLSLVQQAIDCAWQSGVCDQVVVSTDDPNLPIRAATIIVRPPEISGPSADITAAVKHALHSSRYCDQVVTLQPAVLARSPLIVRTLVLACRDADACGLTCAHTVPWHWRVRDRQADLPWITDAGAYPRSQDSPACWAEVNAVQVATAAYVEHGERWGLPLLIAELPAWAVSLDIDLPSDLAIARRLWPFAKAELETWIPRIHRVDAVRLDGVA